MRISPGKRPSQPVPTPPQSRRPRTMITAPRMTRNFPSSGIRESGTETFRPRDNESFTTTPDFAVAAVYDRRYNERRTFRDTLKVTSGIARSELDWHFARGDGRLKAPGQELRMRSLR